ncbi:MAG TPA: hypothetical protein VF680_17320 [Allosphingosinicella sp.]|jgi:hypothetical protein
MDINDLDRITLAEGETLILRPRKPWSVEHVERVMQLLTAKGIRAVIVSDDVDMFIGVNIAQPAEPEPEPERVYDHVYDAYQEGKVIMYRERTPNEYHPELAGDWHEAHRYASPHKFDADTYEYRLRPESG